MELTDFQKAIDDLISKNPGFEQFLKRKGAVDRINRLHAFKRIEDAEMRINKLIDELTSPKVGIVVDFHDELQKSLSILQELEYDLMNPYQEVINYYSTRGRYDYLKFAEEVGPKLENGQRNFGYIFQIRKT